MRASGNENPQPNNGVGRIDRGKSTAPNGENPQPNNGVGRIDRGKSTAPNGENPQPNNGVGRIDRGKSTAPNGANPQPNNGVGRIDRGTSTAPNDENRQPNNGVGQTDQANRFNTHKTRNNEYGGHTYVYEGNGKRKKRERMREIANKKKLKHTGEQQIHTDETQVNRDESMPSNAKPAAYVIETIVEYEMNVSTDIDINPDTIVVVEQEAMENLQPVAISSLCVRCEEQSSVWLTCKHTVCQRCERIEHWAANNQPCNKCGELDSLKQQIAKLENQLKSPHSVNKATKASKKVMEKRCKKLHKFILKLSGQKKKENDDDQMAEIVTLLSAYLNKHPDIAVRLRNGNVKGLEGRLTGDEDLEVFVEVRLTDRQRRVLVSELNKRGLNPFAPYKEFVRAKKEALMETHLESTTIDLLGLYSPFVRVANVKDALTQKVRDMQLSGQLLETPDFHGKIVVTIGGDKGGSTTKLVASIANAKTPNSPNNQVILGTYKGKDDAEDLRRALTEIAAELSEITALPVPVKNDPNGAMTEVPVEFFLIGDTMFLSAALGHMGPNARYPCPFCLQPKDALKVAKHWIHKNTYDDRTMDTYKEGAELAETTTLKGAERSELTQSVNQLPLFQIPIANVCPPQMHIALRIGDNLFKSLEEDCRKHDMKSAGLNADKDAKATRENLKKRIAECKQRIAALRLKQHQTETLRNAFIKARTTPPPKPAMPCEGIVCMTDTVEALEERPCDRIRCIKCRREFHPHCEGLATLAEMYGALDGYRCRKCTNAKADISVLIERTAMNYEYNAKDLRALIRMESKYEEDKTTIDEIIDKNNGPCAKRLAEALKTLKVDKSAFPTCSFVGNHMRTLLTGEGPALLAAALGDYSEDREKYETLFTGLGRIQYYFKAEFLTDSEILELERCCDQFAVCFKQLMPDHSITPKMHFLVTHVPSFARRHKTLGFFSEQSLESLHAKINGYERQFSGIRDPERRMKMIVQHFHLSTSVRAKTKKD
jgi:hypothetical protein